MEKKYKITINNYSADCKYLQIGNFIFLFSQQSKWWLAFQFQQKFRSVDNIADMRAFADACAFVDDAAGVDEAFQVCPRIVL